MWRVTRKMWYLTHDRWGEVSSLALMVWEWRFDENISTNFDLMNHKAVYRTALAKLSLLNIGWLFCFDNNFKWDAVENSVYCKKDSPGRNLSLGTFRKNIIRILEFCRIQLFWVVRSHIPLYKSGEQWDDSRSGLKQLSPNANNFWSAFTTHRNTEIILDWFCFNRPQCQKCRKKTLALFIQQFQEWIFNCWYELIVNSMPGKNPNVINIFSH